MGRNIVICSDGTGNTFDEGVSNVTRLIKLLALDDRQEQIVVYDQGIGTNAKRLRAVIDFRETIRDKNSLEEVTRREYRFALGSWPARLFGLAGGYGLRANVRGMYQKLSRLYEGPADKIYFFGFSRGAFTLRVLAGLLYHCGLPGKDVENYEDLFDEAFQLYEHRREDPQQIDEDCAEVAAFRKKHPHVRDCQICFLGIWDTVKSYGVIWPRILPYLRHNPCVRIVRQALALNERRSWFNATTWGQLDLDEQGALKRLKEKDRPGYERQDIEEVWFRGCHSDIGGGVEEVTARIALRWMLGEAHAAGVRLGPEGESMLKAEDSPVPAEIHESLRGCWWLAEYCPRWEIDNSGTYPVRRFSCSRTGRRNPDGLTRNKKILLHTSVGDLHSLSVPVEHRPTKSLTHPRTSRCT